MTAQSPVADHTADSGYRHEALLYAGLDDFLASTIGFIEAGIALGDSILVVVDEDKIDALKLELGPEPNSVVFADMTDVGANPARLIGLWHDFLAEHGRGRAVRGIGEPAYAGRSADEFEECQLHEALLNIAFARPRPFWLVCPYDVASLGDDVVAEAFCTHPYVTRGDERRTSTRYRQPDPSVLLSGRLSPVPGHASSVEFGPTDLAELRHFVRSYALYRRFLAAQVGDIELAVHEVAANAIRHGDGHGIAHLWMADDVLYFEIDDSGRFTNVLAGRIPPPETNSGGRGLWIANQICDLLQIRTSSSGTVVRGMFRQVGIA